MNSNSLVLIYISNGIHKKILWMSILEIVK